MQDILTVNARELAAAAAFQSASIVYGDLTGRAGFFMTDQVNEDDDFTELQAAIEALGGYAIDRRPAAAVVITHARRLGYLNDEQDGDIYSELAISIFSAHAIATHEAIVHLQDKIRKALAESEADNAGRVTTMKLEDSIFKPGAASIMEIDPIHAEALKLMAKSEVEIDEEANAGETPTAVSLGAPEQESEGAMALGTIADEQSGDEGDEGEGDDTQDDPAAEAGSTPPAAKGKRKLARRFA